MNLPFIKSLGKLIGLLLLFFSGSVLSAQQGAVVDSLLNVLKEAKKDTDKVDILLSLDQSSLYQEKGNFEYLEEAISLSKSINYLSGQIEGLKRMGIWHHRRSEYSVSLDYYNQAKLLAYTDKDSTAVAKILNNQAITYLSMGDVDTALKHYHEALEVINEDVEQEIASVLIGNIGQLYLQIDNLEKALVFLKRALKESQALKNEQRIQSNLSNIGLVYMYQGEYEKSYPYLTQTLKFAKKSENNEKIGDALTSLGEFHQNQDQLGRAKEYFEDAVIAYEKTNNLGKKSMIFTYLGDLEKNKTNYTLSNKYFLKSLEIINSKKMSLHEETIYQHLAHNYSKLGLFQKAFEAQQQFIIINDSLQNNKNKKQLLELSTKYEVNIKEKENKHLKEQNIANKAIIKQRTILGVASSLILLLISALTYILYKRNQQRRINNKQLKIKVELLNENLKNQKTIEIQSKKLRLVEQQKNKIFTNIAHEFQTPLTIIQGLSKQLFKTEQLSSSGNKTLDIILSNSQSLSKATNQILGNRNPKDLPPKIVLFSLHQMIHHILPIYDFLAKEKQITIEESGFDIQNVVIYSDVNKLVIILKNLLSNAIKYTNKGGVITFDYSINKKGIHQISIKDNGRGMKKNELPYIFDRYYQSEDLDAEGGFGLGLAICKEYIESLGGTIEVYSDLGKGSTFTICLPNADKDDLSIDEELYQFPISTIPVQSELNKDQIPVFESKRNLLIVEDNKDFCKFLNILLQENYNLDFVHDGEEALAYLKENKPCLIITDWMMPGVDGVSFVKQLKASNTYRYIPVLMLTARNLASDKIKALRVGVDDYLVKPFEEDILKIRINHLLQIVEDDNKSNQNSSFDTIHIRDQEISIQDQDWLINLETIILPLLNDFDLNIDKIVNLSNESTKQLNNKIKRITGLTSKKYIQELRYWEARRMLEMREYDTVKAVCYSVGFRDSKNFSRKFKERFGKYPSHYLNNTWEST